MFQLGRYLQYPRRAGSNDKENAKWEHNARLLITLWGGNLSGYAQRQYGGLMADFNLPCWKAYLRWFQPGTARGQIQKLRDGEERDRALDR